MTDPNEIETDWVSRRKTLKGIGAGAAALVGVTGQATAAPGNGNSPLGEWTQFQYDAAKTGLAPTKGPRNDAVLNWEDPTQFYQSSPVVADGMVYATGWSLTTYGWDAETGEVIWEFPAGNAHRTPAFYNDTIYFASAGRGDKPGSFYAVNAKTGELRWKNHGRGGSLSSGVTVANDTLYYGASHGDSQTIAVDPDTGEELWTHQAKCHWCPAVKNGRLYAANNGGTKFALDANTGERIWTQSYSGASTAPTVKDGTVYWGSGRAYFSYDAETGEKAFEGRHLYRDPTTDSRYNQVESSPVVTDGVLYGANSGRQESSWFGEIDEPGAVYAVDIETAEAIWRVTEDDGYLGTAYDPGFARGILYVGENYGTIWGIDSGTGEVRFSTNISDSEAATPAVVNGSIFVGAGESMFALEDPSQR